MTTLKIPGLITFRQAALLFIFSLVTYCTYAQSASPYSRFGLGSLQSNVFSANRAMGGLSAPYANNPGNPDAYINFANPASYASLPSTTFEFGANLYGGNIAVRDTNYSTLNAGVNHFAMAFVPRPRHNHWAISAGMLPYSNVNYNFTQHFNDTVLGAYSQVNTGRGSTYQLYAGGAFKVDGFSVGANIGYIFGKIDYEKRIELPDSVEGYNTRNITSLNVKGFTYNIGVTYQKLLHGDEAKDHHKDIYVTAGLYGSSGVKLNARVSSYWDRYLRSEDIIIVSDTVKYDLSTKGKITMPFNIGAGLMFGNESFWLAGADFKYANWKDFSSPINNGGLSNSWRISIGGQITPKIDPRAKYLARVQYRAGAYFGKSEASFQGKGLNEYAGTFGFGLPLKITVWASGYLNLTGEVGGRAINSPAAIRESYYRFTFGLVLTPRDWFIKAKLD